VSQSTRDTARLRIAKDAGVRIPQARTLARYGLSVVEWLRILSGQGWTCAVCDKPAGVNVMNIDHEHVPGWKNLPPEERKRYVRGILCWSCNWHGVPEYRSADFVRRVANYLAKYERRRARAG
jgi:hypothetical protein